MNSLQEKVIRRIIDTYEFFTTDELSEMTGLSVSSIKHSLGDIRSEVEKYDAKLLSIPRKGLCLVATEEQREAIIEQLDEYANKDPESFFYRRNYILETLFYYPANYTIQLFADELCVSRNIIQKDLDNIEEYLKQFHLKLVRIRNQGIAIEGGEFDLRQAIVDYENQKYWKRAYVEELPEELDYRISKRAYTFFTNRYPKEHVLLIQSYLKKAEEYLGVTFVDISFCRLTEYLLLAVLRVQDGKIIKDSEGRKLERIDPSFIEAAKAIFEDSTVLEDFMKYEYQFLAAKLMVARTCSLHIKPISNKYDDLVSEYLQIILVVMQKKQVIEDQELIDEISAFIEQIVVKREYMLVEWDDLHRDVQTQLQHIYTACMSYIFYIENYLGFVLTQDELAWIALLIHNHLEEHRRNITAVLVTATDEYTTKYQSNKIQKAVEGLNITKTMHIKDFSYQPIQEDFLISTVPLKLPYEKGIEVTKHISQIDMNKITARIEQLDKDEKMLQALEKTKQAFSKDLILTDVNVETRDAALVQACQLLYEHGYIEKAFDEEIRKRENNRPTTVGDQIAMPHIYKDYVKKSGVAVIRFKYPVHWTKTDKVKLLFLLAIDYDTSEEILRFFQYFYEIIASSTIINGLLEANTVEDVYEILTEKIE